MSEDRVVRDNKLNRWWVKRDELEITTWIGDVVKRDRWVRDNNLNRWCSEER